MKTNYLEIIESRKHLVYEIETLLQSNSKSLSQNQLAKKIGISPSQLFNIRNEVKWDFISDKTWNKLSIYFQKSQEWKIIETLNYRIIQALCKDAHNHQRLLCVYGKSGLGKTTALKGYANSNSNACYVLADYLQRSKDFFRAIATSLNIEVGGNVRSMLQTIIDKILSMKNPVIIIDDAGKLNDANYKNIQLLYDATEGHLGIVLSGTHFLKDYVIKMALKGKMGFDEFKRRVEYWQPLQEPKYIEIDTLCKTQGIEKKDCINYLYNTVKDFGSIKSIIVSAKRSNAEVTPELLAKLKS